MTIITPSLIYKQTYNGQIVIIKDNTKILKRTFEETLLSITKDYTKKKLKANSNKIKLYLKNSFRYFNKINKNLTK
jgi:Rad3-related DNA helicase